MTAKRSDPQRTKYLVLRELLTGSVLQASISNEVHRIIAQKEGLPADISKYIHNLEADGLIKGYVPVLTEKGARVFDALATIYGDNHDVVEEGA